MKIAKVTEIILLSFYIGILMVATLKRAFTETFSTLL